MNKRRMWYYLLLASGWTILLFHLSSMSYMDQDIRPYLRMFVEEERVGSWLAPIELTYNGGIISVDRIGAYSVLEFFIRKGAHLFFYAMLGYVLVRYFYSVFGNRYGRTIVFSYVLLIVIAMLDEYLQHLHPHRSGQMVDVWLDVAGGLIGISFGVLFSVISTTKKSVGHSV